MPTDLAEFVSAGFRVTRTVARRADLSAEWLPPTLVSLSGCIAAFVPESWCIAWTNDAPQARLEDAARFGLDAEALAAMTEWVTQRFDSLVRWPNVLSSLDAAQELVLRFLGGLPDIRILEVGLHRDLIERFCEAAEPPPQQPGFAPVGRQGIHELVLMGKNLAPYGTPLGFEPVVFDYCLSHSWLCSYFSDGCDQPLKLKPNSHGLIDDYDDAQRCVEFISQDETAEPGLWLPWLIVDHTAQV